jgi:predicted  nucleic acid-binding Zn-ribbon protein
MSLEDLKHNIISILESVEKYDSIAAHSKEITDQKQLRKLNDNLEETKDFILKLRKKLTKLIEHERREIKA